MDLFESNFRLIKTYKTFQASEVVQNSIFSDFGQEGEVEQVVSVAGVRGAEAEDEALEHLYYRKSMKGLSTMELQKALGKLLKKKSITKDPTALQKINGYINQIEKKLKK